MPLAEARTDLSATVGKWVLVARWLCSLSARCWPAPSYGGTITALYRGNDFTTDLDASNIGPRLYAQVWLEFGPSVLFTFDVTGTYTLADNNLHWTALFNYGSSDYFVSSSQGLNFIDPRSSVTFDHGLITDWAIVGNASGYGTAFLESTSPANNPFGDPARDYILEPDGSYAVISGSSGTWGQYQALFPLLLRGLACPV